MLSTFLLRIMSFLSIENFKGSVLCLGGINSGLRNLRKEEQGGTCYKKKVLFTPSYTLYTMSLKFCGVCSANEPHTFGEMPQSVSCLQ